MLNYAVYKQPIFFEIKHVRILLGLQLIFGLKLSYLLISVMTSTN